MPGARGIVDMDRWPLVGRFAELDSCRSALSASDVGALLLVGEAGSGKTRLADEVCHRLQRAGTVVHRSVASASAASTPLAALAHLLPEGVIDIAAASLDPVVVFRRTAVEMARQAKPHLIAVDDIHLLDGTSLALLGQLVANSAASVLGTVRSGEPLPDGLRALERSGRCRTRELPLLDRDDVDALLHLAMAAPVDAALAEQLWDRSQGNPLMLRELVRAGRQASSIENIGGVWMATGALPGARLITDLFNDRLSVCSPAARQALDVVALCEPVGLDLLERVATLEAIDELETGAFVSITEVGRRHDVSLAHPMLGEVLRTAITRSRARSILRVQVDLVETLGARRRQDSVCVASWRLASGLPVPAALLLNAARLARHAHDFHQVERFARAAWTDGADAVGGLMLAEALVEMGRLDEADEVFSAVAAASLPAALAVIVATERGANLMAGLLRPADALAVNELAMLRATDVRSRELLRANRAWLLMVDGQPAAAMEHLGPDPIDADRRLFLARARVAAPCLTLGGKIEQGLDLCRLASNAFAGLDDVGEISGRWLHQLNEILSVAELGRLVEAQQLAAGLHRRVVATGDVAARVWATISVGRVQLQQGRVESARRWFLEASSLSGLTSMYAPRRWALIGLIVSCAMAGDASAAATAVGELDELPGPYRFLGPEEALARGWAAAAVGEIGTAIRLLAAGADLAVETGHLTSAAWMLHDIARLGAADAVAARLQVLASRADGTLVAARAAHATAAASGEAAGLLDASAALEATGMLLCAAEAATAAGDVLSNSGQRRQASAAAERARVLTGRCEGARTPALISTAGFTPMTRREREIAQMAGGGLSARDIAATLLLSTRTVENHLQRVFEKLGITSRAELAAFFKITGDHS